MKAFKFRTICLISIAIALCAVGCGGNSKPSPVSQGKPIDPSGNWKLSLADTNSNTFIFSALFNQVGADVTALNIQETGNGATFQCVVQNNATMANGLVSNVSTFSGDISGNFGTIHFTSTLNDPGTHAAGTYTITPPQGGNCLGVALTGTFTGDEVPSMTGSWTGTVTCVSNCPTGVGSGNVMMSLTQNDATGAVNGSYTITGLPGFSSGTVSTGKFDLLSGASLQLSMLDQNGIINVNNVTAEMVGGPFNSFGTAGLTTDRSFHGNIVIGGTGSALYSVVMSH